MDTETIEATLFACAKVRIPTFMEGTEDENGGKVKVSPRAKIEQLESYILLCADARGRMEEARLWANAIHAKLKEEWDDLTGWEVSFKGSASKATGPQIMEAKKQIRPDLYGALTKSKWLIDRLSEQIRRIEKDEDVTSRVYTFIAGG